jgi:hypothetical protein
LTVTLSNYTLGAFVTVRGIKSSIVSGATLSDTAITSFPLNATTGGGAFNFDFAQEPSAAMRFYTTSPDPGAVSVLVPLTCGSSPQITNEAAVADGNHCRATFFLADYGAGAVVDLRVKIKVTATGAIISDAVQATITLDPIRGNVAYILSFPQWAGASVQLYTTSPNPAAASAFLPMACGLSPRIDIGALAPDGQGHCQATVTMSNFDPGDVVMLRMKVKNIGTGAILQDSDFATVTLDSTSGQASFNMSVDPNAALALQFYTASPDPAAASAFVPTTC